MQQTLSFDQLPSAVAQLFIKLESIEKLLSIKPEIRPDPVLWFDIDGLCDYHTDKPAKATVYGWVHTEQIPYYKTGKKLRFLKSEIDLWLQSGKRKTQIEIANEATEYINKKSRK